MDLQKYPFNNLWGKLPRVELGDSILFNVQAIFKLNVGTVLKISIFNSKPQAIATKNFRKRIVQGIMHAIIRKIN
jgi:hypothetical protein